MARQLLGEKVIAAFFGVSVRRLRQITNEDRAQPDSPYSVLAWLPMNGQRYLPLEIETAELVRDCQVACRRERPDTAHAATGKFTC